MKSGRQTITQSTHFIDLNVYDGFSAGVPVYLIDQFMFSTLWHTFSNSKTEISRKDSIVSWNTIDKPVGV